jgi:hypothetical protein
MITGVIVLEGRQLQLNFVHSSWRLGLLFLWHVSTASFNIQETCCCNQRQWRTYTIFRTSFLLNPYDLHLHTYYQISCPFLQTIVLSVFLRYTDSDYPFGIFKLFLAYQLYLLWNIPMACINCLIQYTGDVLLQSTPMKNIYDISYLVSSKSVMYCWHKYPKTI